MHTSPWSTGVRRGDASSWYSPGTWASAGGVYLVKTPAVSARLRKVLSTPKKTSPTGFDLVRITWLSAAPASPACRTLTLTPVCFVKAASTDFDTANESWVTRVIVVSAAAVAVVVVPMVPTAASAAIVTANRRRRIRNPSGSEGRRRAARGWRG